MADDQISAAGGAKKLPQGIYDPDLDLGYQLKTADAKEWGRDYKQLANLAAKEKRLLSSGNQ